MALGPKTQPTEETFKQAEKVIDQHIQESTDTCVFVDINNLPPLNRYVTARIVESYKSAGWKYVEFVCDEGKDDFLVLDI